MTTITALSHLALFLFGGAVGGYVGYRWGAKVNAVVQAVESPPPKP